MTMIEITLRSDEFHHENGHCWTIKRSPQIAAGHNLNLPTQSTLELFENDLPIGPAHASHDSIRNEGKGRYSHWDPHLYFSSSDDTKPLRSDRRYKVRAVMLDSTSAQLAAAIEAHRADPNNYRNLTTAELDVAIELARLTLDKILRFVPRVRARRSQSRASSIV